MLAVVTASTTVKGGLVDPEAGLPPDIEVTDRLGCRLELDVRPFFVPTPRAAAAFGEWPADLETVAILIALVGVDLHTWRYIHFNGDAGHSLPLTGVERIDRVVLGSRPSGVRNR